MSSDALAAAVVDSEVASATVESADDLVASVAEATVALVVTVEEA